MQYIIATHGRLALGYVDTIRLVTQVEGLHAVCAYMEDSEFPEDMERLLNSFAPGEPVIVFTDLLGGSVTQKIMELWAGREQFQVIQGEHGGYAGTLKGTDGVGERVTWMRMKVQTDPEVCMTDDKTSSCG